MSALYYKMQPGDTALVIARKYLAGEEIAMRDRVRQVNDHSLHRPLNRRSEIVLFTEWLKPNVQLVPAGQSTSGHPIYTLMGSAAPVTPSGVTVTTSADKPGSITTSRSAMRLSADFYPAIEWPYKAEFITQTEPIDCEALARRLCRSYRHQIQQFEGFGQSAWKDIADRNSKIHDSLLADDVRAVSAIVENPVSTNMFWGFDLFTALTIETYRRGETISSDAVATFCDRLLRLGEAVGASSLWYPEGQGIRKEPVDIARLLDAIEATIGFPVDFPNPFKDEFGLSTPRGVASERAIQSLYQAYCLRELSRTYGGRIVEIGAGLGRVAYYCHRMGLTEYAIIDLPLTTMAQAIFLVRTLGVNAVTLPGEPHRDGAIRIETPSWFFQQTEPVDIVLNVDSMPEMDREHAEQYVMVMARIARAFLSINHEFGSFMVSKMERLRRCRVARHPYWLRKGYAEELFVFRHREKSPSLLRRLLRLESK